MTPLTRVALSSGVGLAVLAGVGAACPGVTTRLGLDVWNVSTLRKDMADANRRYQELVEEDQATLNRIALKQQLVYALAAGRVELTEVAAGFRDLNRHAPVAHAGLLSAHPGTTEAEAYCYNVISYARCEFTDDPSAAADVLPRLRRELDRLRAEPGGVRLPE